MQKEVFLLHQGSIYLARMKSFFKAEEVFVLHEPSAGTCARHG